MTDHAALLVKWLTHDLASPIATVMTASELLSEIPDAEINGLVQDGARRLVARLRLVRAALAPGDAPMGGGALERLVRDGLAGTPVSWDGSPDVPHPAMVAGAALLLADLRRNQPLTLSAHAVHWASPHSLPAPVAAALVGAAATDSRSALAAMIAATATRHGLSLTVIDTGISWEQSPA